MKKLRDQYGNKGSVLVIAILTITILALICAVSLNITSQNSNATAQTAAWQQALAGAESGVDQAISALNTGTWTNWSAATGNLPSTPPVASPTPFPTASGAPITGSYNFCSRSISPQSSQYNVSGTIVARGEGSTSTSNWTTIDTAGMPRDPRGLQWYRIRSTGTALAPPFKRVSNQKLDSDLRKIGLRVDRKTSQTLAAAQATRTIEVIVSPNPNGLFAYSILLRNQIQANGSATIHGDVAVVNSVKSDLGNIDLYGNLTYSGEAVQRTKNVEGTISTPCNSTMPSVSSPNWAAGSYTVVSGGNLGSLVAGPDPSHPQRYKVEGDLTLGGGILSLLCSAGGGLNNAIEVWVTGALTTSGSGGITQAACVNATWYVGNNITLNGNTYNNQSGSASKLSLIGYGANNNTATFGGTTSFVGTLEAPDYNITINGSGDGGGKPPRFVGALIGNSLTIVGSVDYYYDTGLGSGVGVSNYAFASWFEDTR
jgi:Tfp pilus assembly protein PilX